ncbi:MAG TPA: class I SAM-dependent methyltransferase, partial [Candidatus Angelobacter sp.]|nr:class I SAM-dependent methyltransferase [Candidatus Angelobacter sp.]
MPEQANTSAADPHNPHANASSNVRGTTPAGTSDERSAANAVRQMFDEIAPRYDFLNHVLSMNVDRLWWRRTARSFSHVLSRSDARVLDLCAGTGDMSVAM